MASHVVRVRCPAKINLTLRVLGLRDDGYHELDTVFQTVDLWDVLEGEPAKELTLTCDDPRLPVDESNLVLRAARALRERSQAPSRGARLSLSKRIPLEGGLGGGSSDAAGALRLCSRLWDLGWDRAALLPIAAELGADVPFFLFGGTARGRGRGDVIEPLPPQPSRAVLLGCPPFGVPTREVFARLRVQLEGSRARARPAFDGEERGAPGNDLEAVVFEGWPALAAFRDALLRHGAECARLSGSGSTVFGIFGSPRGLAEAASSLEPQFPGWRLERTRTLDRSPDPLDAG